MNARKSMSLIGAAIVIGVGISPESAFAEIDRGGNPKTDNNANRKVSRGQLTAFGSVYVNGVRYSTDSAVFLINGSLGTESQLSVGQVITVYGEYDEATGEGVADVVITENPVEGPISMFNTSAGQMQVLGQTVHFNSDTAWSLTDGDDRFEDLGAGDVIAVSGYRNADGDIVATFVSDRLSDGDFDVTGSIGFVDPASTTFWIDGLSVDYGSANLFGLVGGMPTIGQRVDVTGATLNASGQLIASQVAADIDGMDLGAGTSAELEGLVTGMNAWNEFEIDGTTVRIDFSTQFIDGWIFGMSEDARLEVEGDVDVNGVLIADTVRFGRASNVETSGFVESIGNGTFVVGGRHFTVSAATAWEDDCDDGDRRFGLNALRTGDYVTVRGYGFGYGVTATRVDRSDYDGAEWYDDWDDDGDWDDDWSFDDYEEDD